MKEIRYTVNWFSPRNFKVLEYLKFVDNVNFLEIGSFEGLSTNYFIDNFLCGKNSFITCIDPFIKYGESTLTKMSEWDVYINESTYDKFINNTFNNRDKIILKRGLSADILPTLEQIYDFIYVDGDHSEDAVWLDAIYSFKILRKNGIIVFDDYNWNTGKKSPKAAIDRFLNEYKDFIEVLDINNQVIVRKI
jgi:predicted O-methyltransferase YrrM